MEAGKLGGLEAMEFRKRKIKAKCIAHRAERKE